MTDESYGELAKAARRMERQRCRTVEALRQAVEEREGPSRAKARSRMADAYARSDPAEQRRKRRDMDGEFDPDGGQM